MIKKNQSKKLPFNIKDMVVYPSHGVGQIIAIEKIEIDKKKIEHYVISMEQNQLVLRIPFNKVNEVNLRKLSSKKTMDKSLAVLKQKAKVRRIMWSRRAQDYSSKINSGDPMLISEVVRDLYRKNNQPEQSYSERQMFQSAVERLARELAAVEKTDHFNATEKIEKILELK